MKNRTSQMSGLIASACVLILMCACGSSAPVRYYNLEALDVRYDQEADDAPGLGVGPLRMPDYLTRSRIVTRHGDAEVIVDDFNRWAEPVDDAVHRIVAANLDGLLDDIVVIAFPYNHFADLHGQVIGRIDRFDADASGHVVLLAQWSVLTPDSEFIVPPRRARYETQASDANDYGAIAAAMSEALAEFSRDIAREFEAASTK